MTKRAPWLILALACLIYGAALLVRQVRLAEDFDLDAFGRLPVLMDGRVQPIDDVARTALLRIRGTTTLPIEGKSGWNIRKASLHPNVWLLEVLAKPHAADDRKIFRVSDAQLLGMVEPAGGVNRGVAFYSFRQLGPRMEDISRRGARIREKRASELSSSDRGVTQLLDALIFYQRLKNSLQPNSFLQMQRGGQPVEYDFPGHLAKYRAVLPAAAVAMKARAERAPFDERPLSAMLELLQPFQTVSRVSVLSPVPPAQPSTLPAGWQNVGTALREGVQKGELPVAVAHLAAMSAAFARGDHEAFNRAVTDHRAWLDARGFGTPRAARAAGDIR